eukprot:1782504-Prorocentrum_lima.AAC.1
MVEKAFKGQAPARYQDPRTWARIRAHPHTHIPTRAPPPPPPPPPPTRNPSLTGQPGIQPAND